MQEYYGCKKINNKQTEIRDALRFIQRKKLFVELLFSLKLVKHYRVLKVKLYIIKQTDLCFGIQCKSFHSKTTKFVLMPAK